MALYYKKIDNPLTIIAIFASLVEVCGTIVLPQLLAENQRFFLVFIMAFPTLLVSVFFVFLWFRHGNLYAPGDFKDEDNFMKWISRNKVRKSANLMISADKTDKEFILKK